MSRIRIFVLLSALVALATAFAACGGDSGSDDPQAVIESATLKGIDSGVIDLSLGIESEGDEGGKVDLSISGPFQSQGEGDLPLADVTATAKGNANGDPVDFEGDLTLLSDRAFVGYEGTEYEVDPTTFGFLKSSFEQEQGQGGQGAGDVTACQKAAEGLEIADFVENLSSEGGEDVDGTSTTKVSGDLKVGSAIDAIIQLTEEPGCAKQLEAAGPLPLEELEEAKSDLSSAVKKAHIDVYVGDDDIIRRVAAELAVEPQGGDTGRVEIDLDLTLSEVNEEQEITAPSGAEPLEGLFKKLGINPLELLEGGGSGLGGLLEGLTGDDESGSSGGGSSPGGGGSNGDATAYLECLGEVETAADLEKCASLRP